MKWQLEKGFNSTLLIRLDENLKELYIDIGTSN